MAQTPNLSTSFNAPRRKKLQKLLTNQRAHMPANNRTPARFDAIYGLPGKLKQQQNAPIHRLEPMRPIGPIRGPGGYAGVDKGAPRPTTPGLQKFVGNLKQSRGQTLPQARQRRRALSQRLIEQAGGKKAAFGADYNPAELQNVLSKLRASGSAPQIPGSPVVQTPGFARLKARRSELLTERRKALKKIYLRGNRQNPGGPKSGRPQ